MADDKIEKLIDVFAKHTENIERVNVNFNTFLSAFDRIKEGLQRLSPEEGTDGIQSAINEMTTQSESIKSHLTEVSQQIGTLSDSMNRLSTKVEGIVKGMEKLDAVAPKFEQCIEGLARANATVEKYNIDKLIQSVESYKSKVDSVKKALDETLKKALVDNTAKVDLVARATTELLETSNKDGAKLDEVLERQLNLENSVTAILDNNHFKTEFLYELLDNWAEERGIKKK